MRFQIFTVDHTTIKIKNDDGRFRYVYAVALMGRDPLGKSVCLHVVGLRPYFYLGLRPMSESEGMTLAQLRQLCIREGISAIDMEVVTKRTIYGFRNQDQSLLKISAQKLGQYNKYKYTCAPFIKQSTPISRVAVTYHTNLPVYLFMLHDLNITPTSWLDVKRFESPEDPLSKCQMDLVASVEDIEPLPMELSVAKMRILSYDIECYSASGLFPDATKPEDQISNISGTIYELGTDISELNKGNKETEKNEENDDDDKEDDNKENDISQSLIKHTCVRTFTIANGSLDETVIKNADDVHQCPTEYDVIQTFKLYLIEHDIDMITGYNINMFDHSYVYDRLQHFDTNAERFLTGLSRLHYKDAQYKTNQTETRQHGVVDTSRFLIPGILNFDLLPMIRESYKLTSYKLGFVCEHFLGEGETKHGLTARDIFAYFKGPIATDVTRAKLAAYCVQDTLLPIRLMDHLNSVTFTLSLSAITRVDMNNVIHRGQEVRCLSQLIHKSVEDGFVVPDETSSQYSDPLKGATVLEPTTGFHQFVFGLDFASLYPSIIQAENFCWTTLLKTPEDENQYRSQYPDDELNVREWDDENGHHRHVFVPPSRREGVLPRVVRELIKKRREVRKSIPLEPDASKRAVLNNQQLALKVSANSFYGFTGASTNSIQCQEIAASITAEGRRMIQTAKAFAETQYGFITVMGDTDSVYVKPNAETILNYRRTTANQTDEETHRALFPLMDECAERMTNECFKRPHVMENEKGFLTFLLLKKKHYAGMAYEPCGRDADGQPKFKINMEIKGLKTQRRDYEPFVKNIVEMTLDAMVRQNDMSLLLTKVMPCLENVLHHRHLKYTDFILSQSLKADYKNPNLPQVRVVEKLKERGAEYPKPGDRVPYVFVKNSSKNSAAAEKAEDPGFAERNGLVLDTHYYLTRRLKNTLLDMVQYSPHSDKFVKFFELVDYRHRMGTGNTPSIAGFLSSSSSSISSSQPLPQPSWSPSQTQTLSQTPKKRPRLVNATLTNMFKKKS